ncbi:TetR-like C-terminal domain-containing protein [Streptomyces sp. GD-15H]|uniref:TetR-like C-terminal domain-containing protein n=1 Tax=Streptomyces sp. GD-15H TaxID=3129112 RepID=UPI003873BD73
MRSDMRRWWNADAPRAGLPAFGAAPDRGSVCEDLLTLCRTARDAMYSRSGIALRSVIHECDSAQAERFRAVIFEGVVEPTIAMLREASERGIEGGEVCSDAANSRVLDVIPAMMMYRSKMCGSEWPDMDAEEMIDRPMVPPLPPSGS